MAFRLAIVGSALVAAVSAALSMPESSFSSSSETRQSAETARVTALHRFAVKGLSSDALSRVTFDAAGDTVPDDRRFALLFDKDKDDKPRKFVPEQWMHKENFLCAFTAPQRLAQLQTSYEIVQDDSGEAQTKRWLTIRDRQSQDILTPRMDLATANGQAQLSQFLSAYAGRPVRCVTNSKRFQFGNTSSGVKLNGGDTRTLHIVNQATVAQVQQRLGLSTELRATRFRPNVVIDGVPPWSEFEWVKRGARLQGGNGLKIRALQRTVRCDGVSVDPLDDPTVTSPLDIPKLLTQHFPEHGPFLGIYAVVEAPGTLHVGDELQIVTPAAP